MIKQKWIDKYLQKTVEGDSFVGIDASNQVFVPVVYCLSCPLATRKRKAQLQTDPMFHYRRCKAYVEKYALSGCTEAQIHVLLNYILKNEKVITREKRR